MARKRYKAKRPKVNYTGNVGVPVDVGDLYEENDTPGKKKGPHKVSAEMMAAIHRSMMVVEGLDVDGNHVPHFLCAGCGHYFKQEYLRPPEVLKDGLRYDVPLCGQCNHYAKIYGKFWEHK